jgi:uncharacterized Zn finger protein
MKSERICDKCGSTNVVLRTCVHGIGEMPYIDFVYYCEECGEMHKAYIKQYHIESVDVLTGEIKLSHEYK